MKKYIAIIAALASIILPSVSFGAISYNRTPIGATISSPVTITVTADSFSDLLYSPDCNGYLADADYWDIYVIGTLSLAQEGAHIATTTLTDTETFNFPSGDFISSSTPGVVTQVHSVSLGFCGKGVGATPENQDFSDEFSILTGCSFGNRLSSSTLGCSIDKANGSIFDYFAVLQAKYFPYMIGFMILFAVWVFGMSVWILFK